MYLSDLILLLVFIVFVAFQIKKKKKKSPGKEAVSSLSPASSPGLVNKIPCENIDIYIFKFEDLYTSFSSTVNLEYYVSKEIQDRIDVLKKDGYEVNLEHDVNNEMMFFYLIYAKKC